MLLIKILVVISFFLALLASSKVTLQNAGFESPPTNLTANSTSQFVLLDTKINVIPGWSFNGTVWYVTAGGNVSLPGNGHGLQLGPNGMINQTFKTDESYDYVLTFTLAPSSVDCANNMTAVNVSGPTGSQVFMFKESVGNQGWQTYGYSIGSWEIRRGISGIQIQSVADTNMSCWPIVDTFLLNGIESPSWYDDNGLVNSGFQVGPSFVDSSRQGILLEGGPDTGDFVQSPLQYWTISGLVKYMASKPDYAVPRGRGAVELLSSSGIAQNVGFLVHGKFTLDFIMGDANDSCVGDLMVFVQVGNTVWNFTMRSIGVGSRERHSVTFKAEYSSTEWVPISFYSLNETRTSNHQALCGPLIDSTYLRLTSRGKAKANAKAILYNRFMIVILVFAMVFIHF